MSRSEQQNLISMTSTGEAQAVFPGGVEILAGETQTPPDERRIRWVRESDGTLIADIAAGGADPVSFGSILEATVHRVPNYVPGIDQTQAALIARDENTAGRFAQIATKVDDTGGAWPKGGAYVFAMAAPNPPPAFTDNPSIRTITDEDGASALVGYAALNSRADVRIQAVASMAIGALGAGATALSAIVDTGLSALDNRPAGSAVAGPLTFAFARFQGGFTNFVGNQLCWGHNITVTGSNTLAVQIQVRNVTAVGSAATSFAGVILVGYT